MSESAKIKIVRSAWGSCRWRCGNNCAALPLTALFSGNVLAHCLQTLVILFLLSFPVVIPVLLWAETVKAEVEVYNILYIASLRCVKN